jgi:hypothetical protein
VQNIKKQSNNYSKRTKCFFLKKISGWLFGKYWYLLIYLFIYFLFIYLCKERKKERKKERALDGFNCNDGLVFMSGLIVPPSSKIALTGEKVNETGFKTQNYNINRFFARKR